MSAARNRVTQEELAKILGGCRPDRAYAIADDFNIPYIKREGVRANGETYTRRVYIRPLIDSALDEHARKEVRRGAA